MLLSRDAILRHMRRGSIVIDPYDDRNLKTVSYDVTLGPWHWRERAPEDHTAVHNMYDKESTDFIWNGPYEAEPASGVRSRMNVELKNIPGDVKVILLNPGETILGHTIEFIGGKDICTAKMYARSSLGRNFIEVCKDAGWGDVGYFNRWTMEITNNSQNFSIPLVVGRRIAQMVFYEVESLQIRTTDYVAEAGKYQSSHQLEELKRSWNPYMMVPQMHKDWEIQDA